MKNIFELSVTNELIERINKLTDSSTPLWGKMNVGQMLAHCNVTYDYVYTTKYKKPGGLKKMLLKLFVKPMVVGDKIYPKNGRTAPDFIVSESQNFEAEKSKLIDYLKQTQALGTDHFNNKESHSFGKLSSYEWNNMFYKHLTHHLHQFGV